MSNGFTCSDGPDPFFRSFSFSKSREGNTDPDCFFFRSRYLRTFSLQGCPTHGVSAFFWSGSAGSRPFSTDTDRDGFLESPIPPNLTW